MRSYISLALFCPSQVDVDNFIYLGISGARLQHTALPNQIGIYLSEGARRTAPLTRPQQPRRICALPQLLHTCPHRMR